LMRGAAWTAWPPPARARAKAPPTMADLQTREQSRTSFVTAEKKPKNVSEERVAITSNIRR
jgi:hypothetical protein